VHTIQSERYCVHANLRLYIYNTNIYKLKLIYKLKKIQRIKNCLVMIDYSRNSGLTIYYAISMPIIVLVIK